MNTTFEDTGRLDEGEPESTPTPTPSPRARSNLMRPRRPRLFTRKWLAGIVTAATAFLAQLITAGEVNKELAISLLGLVSSATVSYLVPNHMTPGGYPER